MLSVQEIRAWAPHAPWATDFQIEQDLLLTRAMLAIFQDRFLASQVAMRGGTMLHKLHAAPAARYSEDIDLVAVGKRPASHIRAALLRVLSPLLGGAPKTDLRATLKLAIRNLAKPSTLIRLEWGYAPTGFPGMGMKLKVEVNCTERQSFYPPVTVPYAPPPPAGTGAAVPVVTYDVDEMLGTKMRALLQRDHARDLFDLAHAWSVCSQPGHPHPVKPTRVVNAFSYYMAQEGSTVTRADFEQDLARKMTLARFTADLHDVLAPSFQYDVHTAATIVRQQYLALLP